MESGLEKSVVCTSEESWSVVALVWYGVEFMLYGAACASILVLGELGSDRGIEGVLPLALLGVFAGLATLATKRIEWLSKALLFTVLGSVVLIEFLLGSTIVGHAGTTLLDPTSTVLLLLYSMLLLGNVWTIVLVTREIFGDSLQGDKSMNRKLLSTRLVSFLLLFAFVEFH